MAVSSYGAATKTSGVVRILKDLDHDLEGLTCCSSRTSWTPDSRLKYLLKNLAARKPASLEVAALLRKTGLQKVPLDLRYVGLRHPSRVRRRLRARLRRAVPQPALRGDTEARGLRRTLDPPVAGTVPTCSPRPTIMRSVLIGAVDRGDCRCSWRAANGDGAGEPPPSDSGISGVVLAGPQCPAVTAVSPCPDRPWDGIVRISCRDSDEVAEVATDAEGEFRLTVEPGTYEVIPDRRPDGIASAEAKSVTVVAGRFAEVALGVDTGIR